MALHNGKIWGYCTVVGAFLYHLSLGYNYTISNMNSYLKPYMKITAGQTVWFHAVVISTQAIGMPLGGILERKIGYRLVEIIGAVLMSGGVMLSSITIDYGLGPFICTYAVMFGFGMGLPYSVLFTLAAEWFPKHRAAVIGIILGGLGMGALVFTPFQTALINPNNLQNNDTTVLGNVRLSFVKLGAFMIALQLVGFILVKKYRNPEVSDQLSDEIFESDDDGSKKESPIQDDNTSKFSDEIVTKKPEIQESYSYTIKEALRSIDFYTIFLMIFFDTAPITLQTSTYKVYGLDLQIDDRFLSTVATCTAIFNCSGRVIWGILCDHLSFKIPLVWFLLQWALLFFTFPFIAALPASVMRPLYTIWVFLLVFSMAGHFVLMPAASSRIFGSKNMATIYGLLYLATCPSALILAAIVSVHDINENFPLVFFCSSGLCLASFILSLFLKDRYGKLGGITRGCANACNSCRYIPPTVGELPENELDAFTSANISPIQED